MTNWGGSDIVVYDKGDALLDENKPIPGIDFEMPQDVEAPGYGLDLPFVLGKSKDRKTGAITKVIWTPEQFHPADLAHRFLWEQLIQATDFMMGEMGVIEAAQVARWQEVRRYVLTGKK